MEVRAVCGAPRADAERFASAHDIPGAYDDLAQMLMSEELDVVHVLTPHGHVQPAREVLAAGVDCLLAAPASHTLEGCHELRAAAEASGRALGSLHGYLFAEGYEKLVDTVRSGRLGEVDQVDIVWNRELPEFSKGPYDAWVLQHPSNVLFDVGTHSFAHAMHLLGPLQNLSVGVWDEIGMPRGLRGYKRWEIRGWHGNTSVRIRFSFMKGYPEHYLHVRGTSGVAHVDFENNLHTLSQHTPHQEEVERFMNVSATATSTVTQAGETLAGAVLAKAGVKKVDAAGGSRVARGLAAFYRTRGADLDARLRIELAEDTVLLAEAVKQVVNLVPALPVAPISSGVESNVNPDVLVVGGTGFIGKALVRRLVADGQRVRVLARDPRVVSPDLRELGIELVRGDLTRPETLVPALEGIRQVHHLARGFGDSWEDYLRVDVEPTERFAELALEAGVERFHYTSSIAIYDAGKKSETITEETEPVPAMLRANPFAHSKVENERRLMRLFRERDLPLVISRPGIVLGRGGTPYHWGIAAWPYHSVCRLYGDGNGALPLVLVDDVAAAMVAMGKMRGLEGQSYNLTVPTDITANDYLDELEAHGGMKVRRVPTPSWRFYAASWAKYALATVGRQGDAVPPSYADWRGRTFESPFDSTKAERELDWRPLKDRATLIEEGIQVPLAAFRGF